MYCFKFPDRETFRSLAQAEGLITEDGDLILASHTHAIDEVGVLTKGGVWDPETGEVITPPIVLDGYHVNTELLAPESWDQYLVVVNSPRRVFAGSEYQSCSIDGDIVKRIRARNQLGQYAGDDPSTPDVDEAWVEVEP